MCGTKEVWAILVGLALFICCSQPSESLRILGMFPINAKSHFNMFESIAMGLAGKGHQIDVYSQFPLKESLPNYKDYSLQGSLPETLNNYTYHEVLQFQNQNIQSVMDAIGNPICQILDHPKLQDLLKNPTRDPPYDLVIVEAFLSNCHLAWGRYLNIPMVAITTTKIFNWYSPSLGNPSIAAFAGDSVINSINFKQRLENFVRASMVEEIFKFYIIDQYKYIKQYFGPYYPDPIELQKDIDLLLTNSHYSFEGIRANTPAVVPIAGVHIKDDNTKLTQEVQKWLDDSKNGCIYFSFGSMVRIETFPKSSLNAFYASFKNIAPVRVLMKIAKPNELPPGLPSNVMTQSWFSQEQVLKHKNTKLFITHGGLMGTLESIYYAVPMVGVPIFGDQNRNVQLYVQKGIAFQIEFKDITEDIFTSAIKEVLHNPVYKNNIDKLSKIFIDRPMKPLDTAIYWIEYIARHGKQALRSPLVDIPWWAATCHDVYAFLLLVAIIILYIFKFLLKKICRFCCSIWKKGSYFTSEKSKKIQ